jgi:hypothetical protein
MHIGGRGGGIKVDPLSKIHTKLVNKNAIKPKKVYPLQKIFTSPVYPPPKNLAIAS